MQFKELESVKNLLGIFNHYKDLSEIHVDNKKYPLIVIEGLDGCGKTTMTTFLAKEFNATIYCTPPDCLTQLRPFFEDDRLLRTAFYALGNYIANMQLKLLLQEKPVILDR